MSSNMRTFLIFKINVNIIITSPPPSRGSYSPKAGPPRVERGSIFEQDVLLYSRPPLAPPSRRGK